jgi:uncharacterized protein (TIGR02145 family)
LFYFQFFFLVSTYIDFHYNKVIKTLKIGTQTWMIENLAYKPESVNYWAYNNDQSNVSKYGYLYIWETAKQVCPTGWHVPSDTEWTNMTTYLGGQGIAGAKLKEAGMTHWVEPNNSVDNSSGFKALPGGYRQDGSFYPVGKSYCEFWTATGYSLNEALCRQLNNADYVSRYQCQKFFGFSMRCIKDY